MRNQFCTLFDVAYLPRALALYRSLVETCPEFRLRAFCMDETTKTILDRLDFPHLEAIALAELEAHDPVLLAVKPTRTQIEYCWTATPAVCLYALEREPELSEITYLDADLMFFHDPAPLFAELGTDSVLLVPHRYAPRWAGHERVSGIYNVQFMTFRRDERGLAALRWWRERCLEWCYARPEDGKFGDQKYLDDWPERFPGVHVLKHPGGGLAPWNAANHLLERPADLILVDGQVLVFYHVHSLRLFRGAGMLHRLGLLPRSYRLARTIPPLVWTARYPLSDPEVELVWEPYLRYVAKAVDQVRGVWPAFDSGFEPIDLPGLGRRAAASIARTARRLVSEIPRWPQRNDRHLDSWKGASVASQMLAVARDELTAPNSVPPYRAFREAIEALLEEFPVERPARFLDFGCGVGHYSELLEQYFPGCFLYLGCDYSPEMIEAARNQWPERNFVVNDLFANTLELDNFEVVCASALVDVLADYRRALDTLLGSRARYVLLHRQRITKGRSRVEIVKGYEGQTTHRSFLSQAGLEASASRHGRKLARTFHVEGEMYSFLLPRAD